MYLTYANHTRTESANAATILNLVAKKRCYSLDQLQFEIKKIQSLLFGKIHDKFYFNLFV